MNNGNQTRLYKYSGPVLRFGTVVANNYICMTRAISEKQARNNICYRVKRDLGLEANTRITLKGILTVEGGQ